MRFLMTLALKLGKTLSELRHSMSASELLMWGEFDRLSPVGDERSDILNAQIVSALYGSQGVKVSIDEAQIQWAGGSGEDGESDPFAALEAELMAAAS